MGFVYLLHFERSYKHARHYVGYTADVEARFERHLSGDGSPLVKAVVREGISVSVARVWEGDRTFERSLKNKKNAPKLCPLCKKEKERGTEIN